MSGFVRSLESYCKHLKHVDCVLSRTGDHTSQAAEVFGVIGAPKAPADLLPRFHHPQISLRLVVVERQVKVEVSQHLVLPIPEPVQ